MKIHLFKRLALITVLFLSATTTSAHDFEVDGIFYYINNDNTTVSVTFKGQDYNSYNNEYSGSVTIPASVTYSGNTYSVTKIGDCAFLGCIGLTAVTIGNSVTSIGWSAFEGCSGLTMVSIGHSVTSIRNSAFSGCSGLMAVEIPKSVTSIGKWSFSRCSGLTAIEIPNSINNIEEGAFSGCSSLCVINVENGNEVYDSRENCNAIIEKESSSLICGCKCTIIPNSVTSINKYAFEGCKNLTSIVLPNSVTEICTAAFRNCEGLTSIVLSSNLISIGDFAFCDCSGLTLVDIPDSVTSIGDYTFYGCSGLSAIEIPNSVTSIGSLAFWECSSLGSIVIPSTVTTIESGTFLNCNRLISIVIPNSVNHIGESAFYGCSGLTSAVIGNSVISIGEDVFSGCANLISFTSLNNVPPTLSSNRVFDGVPINCVLYVPSDCREAYKSKEGWSRFSVINELPAGLKNSVADAVSVRGENGVIRIEGADGAAVEVYNAGGVCIFSGVATEVPVAQRGIYVVKVAGRATKIAL